MPSDERRKIDKNLIVGVVGLMITAAVTLAHSAIIVSNDIAVLKQAVSEKTKDRFHKSEALQHLAVRDERIEHNKKDVTRIAAKIDVLSDKISVLTIAVEGLKP